MIFIGSDLKELCKYAATLPLREYIRSQTYNNVDSYRRSGTPDGRNMRSRSMNNVNVNVNDNDNVNVNTVVSNECTEIFKGLNNGSMLERDENIRLRSITMKDFEIALKHIKSTMQAHTQHKQRYSKGSLYSLFDPFSGGFGNVAGSNSRSSRYSGPPTVSSRSNDNDNINDNYSNNNNNNNINDNKRNYNVDDNNSDSVRAAGEAVDPLHEVDVDVE